MVLGLAALKDDPELAQTVALARIGPAVIDGDTAVLLDCLERLQAGSPWLAQRGLQIACHAGRMWRKDRFMADSLAAAPAQLFSPGLQARIRLLTSTRGLGIDVLFESSPSALSLLPLVWTHHAAWRSSLRTGREVGAALNSMLWDMATDPAGLDAEHVLPAARQLVLANAEGVPAYQADTVAAAMARAGRMTDAISWQQAAITMQRQSRMDKAAQREYEERLASYRRGEPAIDGLRKDGVPSRIPGAGGIVSAGLLVDGLKAGVWTTTAADGTVTEELGHLAGKPCGVWLSRATDGTLRWSGWVNRGSRLGWWRIRTRDGGLATGWYDGKQGGVRCGLWQLYDKDGTLRSEGPCVGDSPIRPWTTVSAGKTTMVDPASIVLPEHPPLPAGAAIPDEAAEQTVEAQRPSDF